MIAHDLMINSANVEIRNTKMRSMLMPYLDMVGKSSIYFNISDTPVFLLRYRQHFTVDPDSFLDFS